VIVAIVWAAAVLFGAVILTFCAYEIRWKLARLQRDTADLQQLLDGLRTMTGHR
jgi:hypothetical protein